jgi:hypothetical protein
MNVKLIHLAGASLSTLALLSATSSAQANVHHKTHKHAGVATPTQESVEITELKAEVDSLQSRLDAQEAAQRVTADQAATAQATAQAAQGQVAQVAARTANVSGQIKSAINTNAPSASSTTVSGTLFLDASNIVQRSVNGAGAKSTVVPSGTGVDIKRAYLSVDHTFNKTFSADLTVDFQASGAYSKNVNLSGANIYIKNAYLQAKIADPLIVRLGVAPLPWTGYVDGITGQRYIEQSVTDRLKLANTADYGVHVLGTLGDPKGFNITYAASAVNGGGYKNPNRSNNVDIEGRVALAYHGFNAAVGGYTGKFGNDTQAIVAPTAQVRTASRLDALVAYKGPVLGHAVTVGAEYFWTKDNNFLGINSAGANPLTVSQTEIFGDGYSAFASVNVTPKISLFGRYDWTRPQVSEAPTATTPYTHETFYDAGLSYAATKGVDISLVYKHDKLRNLNANTASTIALTTQDAGLTTGAGTGSAPYSLGSASYDEFGIFTQVKF